MRAQISVTLALLHLQNCAAAPLLSSAVESGTSGDVLHPLNLTDPSTIPRIGTPVIGVPQRIGIPDFDLPTSECVTCEGSQTIGETVSVEPDKTTTDVESNAVSNTRRSALAIDPDALICGRSYDSKGNLVVKRCGVEEPYLPKEVLDLPSLEVPTPSTISPDTLATSNGLDRRAISFGNKRSPLVECSLNAGGKEECKYYDGMMHPVQTTTASASPEFSSVFGKRVETTKEADETKKKRFVLGDCPIIAKRSDGSYFRDCGYSSPEGPLDHLNITSTAQLFGGARAMNLSQLRGGDLSRLNLTSLLGPGPEIVDKNTVKRKIDPSCFIDRRSENTIVRRCSYEEPIYENPISHSNLTDLLSLGPESVQSIPEIEDESLLGSGNFKVPGSGGCSSLALGGENV